MEDELIEILGDLGYPVLLQGSLLPNDAYPASFFTFWNDSADGAAFYDDDENAIVWEYSLNFYSNDPEKTNTELIAAKNLLKQNGWSVYGAGYSVPSDEQTHTGRGITIKYRREQND